jgi:hypothetical protein
LRELYRANVYSRNRIVPWTTLSELRGDSEASDAQVLGGILEDQLQTLPRGAFIPAHHPALQFVSICLQHPEQPQLPEPREEPVLERRLEPRPVRRVIDEPASQPVA